MEAETALLRIGHRPVDARLRRSLTPCTPKPRPYPSSAAPNPGARSLGASTRWPEGCLRRRRRRRRCLHRRFINPGLWYARDRDFQGAPSHTHGYRLAGLALVTPWSRTFTVTDR